MKKKHLSRNLLLLLLTCAFLLSNSTGTLAKASNITSLPDMLALPPASNDSVTSLQSDLANRYVVFLDGIRSESSKGSPLNGDFNDIQNKMKADLGIDDDHFVYFSYSAAAAHQVGDVFCLGWGSDACSTTTVGDLTSLNVAPIYTVEDTQLSIDEQADALEWLLGQIVAYDPSAQIDLVGFSLGGIVASRWASQVGNTSELHNHVHSIVLIESPVGGIPLAGPITAGCGPLEFACKAWNGILDYIFGETILRELQLPPDPDSIVDSLSQAAQNFPVTSIQSTGDYLVNRETFPLCRNLACTASDEVPVGQGSQLWPSHTLHDSLQLSDRGLATAPLSHLAARELILENHNAPLSHPQTAQWVIEAIQQRLPTQTTFADCYHDYEGVWYCDRENGKYRILYADLSNPSVRVDVVTAAGYSTDPQPFFGETVEAMAHRYADRFPGLQVIAGINANYFGPGHHGPQGLVKATTEQGDTPLFSEFLDSTSHDGVEKKSSLGISPSGQLLIARNFYDQHADFINGNTGGGRAITAGPRIIWESKVSHQDNFVANCDEEDYTQAYCTEEAQRAALATIGQTGLVLTVGEKSVLQETAKLLEQHGVEHAIKLDDGSSAQLWYIDESFIPQGGGNGVVNALLIYSKPIKEPVTSASSATVLVIDVSGSMEWPDTSGKRKIDAARDAGQDIVNMLSPLITDVGGPSRLETHEMGLISFTDLANLESPLTSDLTTIENSLARLQPVQGTNMAHGLTLTNKQLANADPTARRVLILLSDGIPTVAQSGIASEDRDALKREILDGPVALAQAQNNCIYTIGFGEPGAIDPGSGEPSIDVGFLKAIAAASASGCGGYFPATDTFELTNVYAQTRCESLGNCIDIFGGQVAQGETTPAHPIQIPDAQSKLFASLNWPGSSLKLILKDPAGTEVDEDYQGSSVSVFDNLVYVIVDDPMSGTWQTAVFGEDVPEGVTPYNVTFSARAAPIVPTPIPEPTEEPAAVPVPPTPEPVEPEPVVEPGSGTVFVLFIVVLLGVVGATAFFAMRNRRTGGASTAGLRLIAGQASPTWIGFRQGRLRLGRGRDNELVISDKDASRHHGRIIQIPQGYLLEDLDSTNGTFVNGERVERQMLHDGDVIQIGHTQFRFEEGDQSGSFKGQ